MNEDVKIDNIHERDAGLDTRSKLFFTFVANNPDKSVMMITMDSTGCVHFRNNINLEVLIPVLDGVLDTLIAEMTPPEKKDLN